MQSDGEPFGRLSGLLKLFDGVEWSVRVEGPTPTIEWASRGKQIDVLTVTRDDAPADHGEIAWIAAALAACRDLLRRDNAECSAVRLQEIEARFVGSGPAPWRLFLESDGGVGGGNVIWVGESDEAPDLYLWLNGRPAPDFVWEFIVEARNRTPALLQSARRGGGSG